MNLKKFLYNNFNSKSIDVMARKKDPNETFLLKENPERVSIRTEIIKAFPKYINQSGTINYDGIENMFKNQIFKYKTIGPYYIGIKANPRYYVSGKVDELTLYIKNGMFGKDIWLTQ